jgi:flavin-dependent thymidylate synthase
MPKVTLLYATPDAVEILIFTKNTRLRMAPEGLNEIRAWPREKKMNELKYMSTTIPSSWEFVDIIFCIEGVSRAFTHQLVRTRTASYAQQAMRVVDMTGFEYHTGQSIKDHPPGQEIYDQAMQNISGVYQNLIQMGAKPEDARGILPTDILTNICMKLNLRAFADLVKKRSSPRVQDEYAEVLKQMVEEVLGVWPWSLMFIMPRHGDAYAELNRYLKIQLADEIDTTGKPQNETQAWAAMKYLDILRQEK